MVRPKFFEQEAPIDTKVGYGDSDGHAQTIVSQNKLEQKAAIDTKVGFGDKHQSNSNKRLIANWSRVLSKMSDSRNSSMV